MSWAMLNMVFARSEARNGARLVHIVLANHANKTRDEAYPSIEKICEHAQLGKTAVYEALRWLEAAGYITRVGVKPKGNVVYHLEHIPDPEGQLRIPESGIRNPDGLGPESGPKPVVKPSLPQKPHRWRRGERQVRTAAGGIVGRRAVED